MDYSKLKSLLDPTKTDQENRVILNAQVITIPAVLQTRAVKEYLILQGKWLVLKVGVDPASMMSMEALMLFDSFDFNKNKVKEVFLGMISALKAELILTQEEHDFLFGLTSTVTSTAEQQLGRKVDLTDIESARNYG